MLLGPRVYEGFPGSHLVQPFVRSPSASDPTSQPSTILVDRGFITSTRANAIREGREEPPIGPNPVDASGEVVIEGMLKKEESQGSFQPKNDPEHNLWFWTDVKAMADWVGGEGKGVQPVLVEQIYGDF
jgi:surfeit locus 1 family protein